MHRFKN